MHPNQDATSLQIHRHEHLLILLGSCKAKLGSLDGFSQKTARSRSWHHLRRWITSAAREVRPLKYVSRARHKACRVNSMCWRKQNGCMGATACALLMQHVLPSLFVSNDRTLTDIMLSDCSVPSEGCGSCRALQPATWSWILYLQQHKHPRTTVPVSAG